MDKSTFEDFIGDTRTRARKLYEDSKQHTHFDEQGVDLLQANYWLNVAQLQTLLEIKKAVEKQ